MPTFARSLPCAAPERLTAVLRVVDADGRLQGRHAVELECSAGRLVPSNPFALGACLAELRACLRDGERVVVGADGRVATGARAGLGALAEQVARALSSAPVAV